MKETKEEDDGNHHHHLNERRNIRRQCKRTGLAPVVRAVVVFLGLVMAVVLAVAVGLWCWNVSGRRIGGCVDALVSLMVDERGPTATSKAVLSSLHNDHGDQEHVSTTAAAVAAGTAADNSEQQQPQLSNTFPSLSDSIEMVVLSAVVYSFRGEANDANVCKRINDKNYTDIDPWKSSMSMSAPPPSSSSSQTTKTLREERRQLLVAAAMRVLREENKEFPFVDRDWKCHWYHHDRADTGTQVMLISSARHDYLAVVFAGTDDLRTFLTDADIFTVPFGGDAKDSSNYTIPPKVRVHEGFDKAVFGHELFEQILRRVREILRRLEAERKRRRRWHYPKTTDRPTRLFTTGHSLGAANAVLTAVGLKLEYNRKEQQQRQQGEAQAHSEQLLLSSKSDTRTERRRLGNWKEKDYAPSIVTSLNFGCPHVGNGHWRDFINDNNNSTSSQNRSLPSRTGRGSSSAGATELGIWRVVLGWDLVARLPDLMVHEGHTIQLYPRHHHGFGPFTAAAQEAAPSTENATTIGSGGRSVRRLDPDGAIVVVGEGQEEGAGGEFFKNVTAKAYYHHYGDLR